MSTDDKISADLAVVSRASRAQSVSLASTIRLVGAQRTVPPTPLLATAAAYANRLAGAVAATWTVVLTIAVLVPLLFVARSNDDTSLSTIDLLYSTRASSAATTVAISSLLVYVLAWTWAARRFEASIAGRDPLGHARRLVDALERASTTLIIAGVTTFTMTFGLLFVVLGSNWDLYELRPTNGELAFDYAAKWVSHDRSWALIAIGSSVFASLAGAIVLGRARDVERWVGVLCAFGVAATILVGLRYDVGPANYTFMKESMPDTMLRTVLVITGFVSLLGLVGAIVSARRRRELAAVHGE